MPVERKRAFQLKYALSLGLRPSTLDPRSLEVLAVQCAFCAAFGREPRAVSDPEAADSAQPGDEHDQDEDGEAKDGAANDSAAVQTLALTPARRPPRARTSNIRSWAPPLRPDNIRLHMRAQHPARFSAYAALVARAKEDGSFQAAADLGLAVLFPTLATGHGELTAVAVAPAVSGAAREMLAYFGDAPVTAVTPTTDSTAGVMTVATEEQAADPATTPVVGPVTNSIPALLVKRVAVPAIVTELLESLVCLADAHIFPSTRHTVEDVEDEEDVEVIATRSGASKRRHRRQGGRAELPTELAVDQQDAGGQVVESNDRVTIRRLLPEDDGDSSGRSARPSTPREKLEVVVKSSDELARVQRLLAMGLSFDQTAQVMALTDAGNATEALSASTIASFARVSVLSAFEMIADLLRRSWTFAIVLDVSNTVSIGRHATRSQEPSDSHPSTSFYRAIDVCVRLPTSRADGSNDALSFHIVALPFLPFDHSLERTVTSLTRYFDVLDPNWTSKLMGCGVNGSDASPDDPETSFSASQLAQRVAHHAATASPPETPFYQLWRPAQHLTDALRRALSEMKGALIINGVRVDASFNSSLISVTTFLRGQESWMRTHGRCPMFDVRCPWSVLTITRWMLARREAVNELYANTSELSSTVYPSAIFWLILLSVSDVLTMFDHVRRELEAFPTPSGRDSRHKLADAVQLLLEKTGITWEGVPGSHEGPDCDYTFGENVSRLGQFEWTREPALVQYVRSLNLSSRRLYAETSVANQGRAEFSITCFVLRAAHSVALLTADSTSDVAVGTAMVEAPPTLPLHFVELSRSRVVDLIEQHSARLEKAFGARFLDRISGDIERLRTLVGTASWAQASPFRLQLERAQTQSFHDAWALLVPHGMASLRRFAAGLATVLPCTDNADSAGADGVRFPANDEDQFRSQFADLAIEARLHCAQAQRLTGDVRAR